MSLYDPAIQTNSTWIHRARPTIYDGDTSDGRRNNNWKFHINFSGLVDAVSSSDIHNNIETKNFKIQIICTESNKMEKTCRRFIVRGVNMSIWVGRLGYVMILYPYRRQCWLTPAAPYNVEFKPEIPWKHLNIGRGGGGLGFLAETSLWLQI